MKRGASMLLGIAAVVLLLAIPAVATADPTDWSNPGPKGLGVSYTVTYDGGHQEQFQLVGNGGCPLGSYAVGHRWNSGGGWSGWDSLGGCVTGWDVGVNWDSRLEVFGLGTDNAVWHKWQPAAASGPWSNWSSLGGGFTTAPWVGSEISGQPYMHVYGTYFFTRYYRYQTSLGCCWSSWIKG